MTPARLTALAAFSLAAAATDLAAQAPALRDLPKATKEIEDPFTLIAGVREGAKGVVIVVDMGDGELSTANFATLERATLGAQGSGPGEYRAPSAVFRVRGDTVWVLDPPQQRIAAYLPDMKAGVPFQLQMFDTQTRTALMAPMAVDQSGIMYANALPVSGPNMQIPDSVEIVKFDPRTLGAPRKPLIKLRFPTSGSPKMEMSGTTVKYTMAFPGLVTADSWAVFPDGRLAIVHGATYTVEFIAADGKRTTAKPIPYEKVPLTKADQDAEMAEAKKQLAEQMKAVKRTMPAGVTLDMNMLPPESWPSTYPAVAPLQVHAAPDGMLWVRRSMPARLDREHWDVIDPSGALVARYRLGTRTRLVGVGAGVVYTIRLDEDELQYLGQVPVSLRR